MISTSEMKPILSASKICKTFGGVEALKDVSFEVKPGEVMALVGDNGAGKSTLIKTLSGVYIPDSGTMTYQAEQIAFEDPSQARSSGIETIYQDLALADNLDVGSNIFLGREPKTKRLGIFPVLDRTYMTKVAEEVIKPLDIIIPKASLKKPVLSLSGGQRQAIAIGRAVYWQAKVLIMDEPTAALGVPEQRKVMELILKLKEQGVAIILISHNMNDVFAVSDRITVLRRGQVVGVREASETNSEELVHLMVAG
ncbi:ATP-binding cassette domain-containing protein [Vibrio penaeicida]|uniref:ABC transporter ATP-binding protein n=1 Tax=Vibrio penaeicida TaxID=104609 RepID=A0AAV5NQU8_9VIBR|nr:ATP-binding cassette domain-containing protein [Vibrio penaeicida]MDP2570634.1 ATP-binding cassette domain-containing protein [Vibrio penaeicida]GLQ72873.1 ABC transporter ATP-binding protein [Vibrio penaeicida]